MDSEPGIAERPIEAPAAASSPRLVFDEVSKTFEDGTEALAAVSLRVGEGEFVSLVGPSGCGKSTVLRIASGLVEPSAGRVAGDPNLGYVFQDPTLLPWRTVRRNVELFCELAGIDRDERARRSRRAIELVGLVGFETSYPRQLSGGMRMRASLARSLTLSPKMFLFDEPFGALDEITRERLNEELLRLFLAQRFGALFVTHSIPEAVFLSTRVLVMSPRPGRIVASHEIPFPYPRDEELRYRPQFAELVGELSRALRLLEP
ncbi:MAG: ABC transporter ATP-binding protein [Acidimicrobiia bacterium]|nr:ABC transporter ATP-binding protein [Acidimicrobiia bacterium]